jgi:hypothetical protein
MANRVSITNKEEFESAISTQKEIGREQYHNYLKSQKMFIDYIEKQAILEFLKERLESRNNRIEEINSLECSTLSEKSYRMYLEVSTISKIQLLEDLIGNIERGIFDATM